MRLGFQYPSPFERIPHFRYGDDGWTTTIRKRGENWLYSSMCANACFNADSPADLFVYHPGEIAVFARLHLALNPGDIDEEIVLDSRQVYELIGPADEVAS